MSDDEMTCLRVQVQGFVQGIGFRDFLVMSAQINKLDGWVRNRADGSVEAVLDGEEAAIAELLRACRRGPRLAEVTEILEELTDTPDGPGFRKLPAA
jgi:acylphosphatase